MNFSRNFPLKVNSAILRCFLCPGLCFASLRHWPKACFQDVDHLLDRGEAFRCIRLMPSCSEVHEDEQSCSPSKTQRFRQFCSGSTPSLHQLQLPCTIIRDPAAQHWLSVPGIGWIWFARRGQAYHQDTVLYRFVTIYGHAVWICLAMPGHGLAHLPPYGAPDPYLGPASFCGLMFQDFQVAGGLYLCQVAGFQGICLWVILSIPASAFILDEKLEKAALKHIDIILK